MRITEARFHYRFRDKLPVDPIVDNHIRQVYEAYCSFAEPARASVPSLIGWSGDLAGTLGLERPVPGSKDEALLAGSYLPEGVFPHSVCYGGHQFGVWAGQLGDGRAISLGEIETPESGSWELQLKGAGPTPYSRRGDGRAVLRSCVREFLASECMHFLGIPTTRALAVLLTGEQVPRDMFYNGTVLPEPGAITVRVARSFLRFGNFEIFASRNDKKSLTRLLEYVLGVHFSHLVGNWEARVGAFFTEVCQSTAILISEWMRVGFVHGVMNTDNMSILGDTIDYGPFGWLDNFRNDWTPNTSDLPAKRYCFGQQPFAALWNLERLGDALVFAEVPETLILDGLQEFSRGFQSHYHDMLGRKLGLPCLDKVQDQDLLEDLFRLFHSHEIDMTLFFRNLRKVTSKSDERAWLDALGEAFYDPAESVSTACIQWLRQYSARVESSACSPEGREDLMNKANPVIVPRNYICQVAIEAAERGDFGVIETLLQCFREPYQESALTRQWQVRRPDWARVKPGCSQLSCSS